MHNGRFLSCRQSMEVGLQCLQGCTVDVLELLDQLLQTQANLPEPEPLVLRETISFENVSFHYGSHGSNVLEGLDLKYLKAHGSYYW